MGKFNLEEVMAQYKGGHIAIIGNGPSVVQTGYQAVTHEDLQSQKAEHSSKRDNVIQHKPVMHVVNFSKYPNPIWVVNGGWWYHKNAALAFAMDDFMSPDGLQNHNNPEWFTELHRNCEIPIITSRAYEDFPASLDFPLERALYETKIAYFAETIDYMLVFAVLCGVSEIDFFGCDYLETDRFPEERSSTEFWCGYAHAKGIRLNVSPYSKLLKAPERDKYFKHGFYGYSKKDFPLDLKEVHGNIEKQKASSEKICTIDKNYCACPEAQGAIN